jgi:hypothetical protein
MAVSDSSGRSQRTGFRAFDGLSRYDLVLTVIPIVLAIAFVVNALLGVPFEVAVAVAAGLSLALVVDALFVHPPVDRRG